MTEEIIIDGVDVAGCISFDKNNGYNICCYDDTREEKIPFANFCVENKDCYYKQLKRLEQENKELKEKYRLSCLKCEYKNTKADVDKYRSALEEIKTEANKFDYWNNNLTDASNVINSILDKINEAL